MVIWPLAALAAPPEIGASRYRMPSFSRRASSATDQFGSTVEHITNRLPGRMWAATPSSPNSTASVCAALTTTETTTSQRAPSSASVSQALPPSWAKSCTTSRRRSNTWGAWPARRSDCAMPRPMAPRPTRPTQGCGVLLMWNVLFLSAVEPRPRPPAQGHGMDLSCHHTNWEAAQRHGRTLMLLAWRARLDQRARQPRPFLLPEHRVGLPDAADGVVHVRLGSLARGHEVAGLDGVGNTGMLARDLAGEVIAARLVGPRHADRALQEAMQDRKS